MSHNQAPLEKASADSSALSDASAMPVVSNEWKLAWQEFRGSHPRVSKLPGHIALVLFTVLGLSPVAIASFLRGLLLPWYVWVIEPLVLMILAQIFASHYSGLAYRREIATITDRREQDRKALESRIAALEDRFRPILTIDYRPDEGEPFVHHAQGLTQYRVSVRSPIALPDVELVVNHLRVGDAAALFDHHLRPMNDRDKESGTKRVTLKAGREKHWDLVCFHENVSEDRNLVYVTFIPALGGVELLPGEYEFELMATGGDTPDATSIVAITVAEDRTIAALNIRPGRLSPLLH